MPQWDLELLGLLAEFRNGLNYTDADQGDGLAVIGVSDFKDNVVTDLSKLAQVNLSALGKADALIRKRDIIFVRSNGNRELIGRSMFVSDAPVMPTSHSGFTIRCRFHDPRCHPRFYAYLLRGPIVRQRLSALGGGTNISNLNQGILSSLLVPIPDFGTQERIASILSAYDDLIENNTRRIAILEEMARRIYEEWFVHFRAPGCEGLPLIESPLGPIPQGWEVVRLDSIIDFDPRVRVAKEEINAFIPMISLRTNSMIIDEYETRRANSGSKFMNGDTLLARITPCLENGKTGFVDDLPTANSVACGSTEFIVMRGANVPPEFVQLLARNDAFRAHAIKSMSGATGRQRVRKESLERYEIAKPGDETLQRFAFAVKPMFNLCRTLADANTNLRAQRDLLLPRLISGEIDVSEAQVLMEAAE